MQCECAARALGRLGAASHYELTQGKCKGLQPAQWLLVVQNVPAQDNSTTSERDTYATE